MLDTYHVQPVRRAQLQGLVLGVQHHIDHRTDLVFKINFIIISILLVKLLLFVKREVDKKTSIISTITSLGNT